MEEKRLAGEADRKYDKMKVLLQKLYEEGVHGKQESIELLFLTLEEYSRNFIYSMLSPKYKSDETVREIFSIASLALYQKEIRGYREESHKENIGTYFLGICKNKTLDYLRKNGKPKSEELEEQIEQDITYQDLAFQGAGEGAYDPLDILLRDSRLEIIREFLTLYFKRIMEAKQEPYQILAMIYAKVLANLVGEKKALNSPGWAMEEMKDQIVSDLSDDSEKRINESIEFLSFHWGTLYQKNLKKPYKKSKEGKTIGALVFTEEFSKKDVENWTERVNKAIIKGLAEDIVKDKEKNKEVLRIMREYAALKKNEE